MVFLSARGFSKTMENATTESSGGRREDDVAHRLSQLGLLFVREDC